jgi:hypothetical protein
VGIRFCYSNKEKRDWSVILDPRVAFNEPEIARKGPYFSWLNRRRYPQLELFGTLPPMLRSSFLKRAFKSWIAIHEIFIRTDVIFSLSPPPTFLDSIETEDFYNCYRQPY